MRGRTVSYGIAFSVLAVVAAAILLDRAIILVAAPLVVIAIVAITFARASRMAATDFYTAFAVAHGFSYSPRYEMVAFTPLLGAGDRRHCSHYMEGPLERGSRFNCAFSHYTFEIRKERHDSDGDVNTDWVPYDFTVCCVELGSSAPALRGIYLARNQSFLDKFEDGNWLKGRGLHADELESSDFEQRYDLLVEPGQDQVALRRLFSPSLIAWFAAHPLHPCFELQAGMLVVYVDNHLDESGEMQWLIEATRELVKRFGARADLRPAA